MLKRYQDLKTIVVTVAGILVVLGASPTQATTCVDAANAPCNTALADFSVSDGTPDFFFTDTDAGQSQWKFLINNTAPTGPSHFELVEAAARTPFRIDGGAPTHSIRVDSSGRVGFGTSTPGDNLHIKDSSFPTVRLENTTSSETWDLDVSNSSGAVRLLNISAGTGPFEIEPTATDSSLVIDSSGVVIGTDLSVSSSRTMKREIEVVDSSAILGRVNALPVHQWQYKDDATGSRHLGPMAEDFHSLFGLGRDQRHISPADAAGVALAAIQELSSRLEQLADENAQLQAEMAILRASRPGMETDTFPGWD